MKALVGAFNQEKALVGAFSVIVQPVVEPMDRFAALLISNQQPESRVQRIPGTMLLSAQPISQLPPGPGQWQHPHNVTQWPVSCVPVLPLCLLCNLAAGQDQDGEPELGTQHRHRAPAGDSWARSTLPWVHGMIISSGCQISWLGF